LGDLTNYLVRTSTEQKLAVLIPKRSGKGE